MNRGLKVFIMMCLALFGVATALVLTIWTAAHMGYNPLGTGSFEEERSPASEVFSRERSR